MVAFGNNQMQRTGRLTPFMPQAQTLRVEEAYFPREINWTLISKMQFPVFLGLKLVHQDGL